MPSPNVSPDFYDSVAEDYDAYHRDPKSLAENRYIQRVLRRSAGPDDLVVDLGCGTGLLLEFLDLSPQRYVGVDLSEQMVAQAKRKHPEHRFLVQDMLRPIPDIMDGTADGVVSLFGSPAYCDVEGVWQQVQRLLRPGGWYFLMFCGPRYLKRSTLIDKAAVGLKPRRATEIDAVCTAGTTWGMSCLADMLPSALPDAAFDLALQFDVAIPGRLFRDACFFLNALGRKPAQRA